MDKKPDLTKSELFSTPVLKVDANAKAGEAAPTLYKKLISDAKKVYDIPGALYIASEVMAFDIPSENYKTVYYDNDAKKLIKSFTEPQPLPLLYNHADGLESSMFEPQDGEPPIVAGRMLSAAAATGMFNTMSAFAGQVVTNPETIERIYNLMDYTQSISILAKGYFCEVCQTDAYSSECSHMPGQRIKSEKTGKESRVNWQLIPRYALEFSFVLVPGYRNARIVSMEQNGLFGDKAPATHGRALFSYAKKEGMITVPDNYPTTVTKPVVEELDTNAIEGHTHPGIAPTGASHVNIKDKTSFEGELNMEQLEKVLNSLTEAVKAMADISAQVIEANKINTEMSTTLKSVVETISKNTASKEVPPVVTTTEPVTTPVVDKPEQNSKQVEDLALQVKTMDESMKALTEQNKAILESISKLTPEPAAPAVTPAEGAADTTPAPDKNNQKPEGDGKGKSSKVGSHYKGLTGSL